MKRTYLIVFLLFTLIGRSFGQTAASYGFSAFSTPYISISSTGTATYTISCDDCGQCSIPIGFTFRYCGVNYTTLAANSNGYLSLINNCNGGYGSYYNAQSSLSYTTPSIGYGVGMIMPFWDDLYGVGHVAYYRTSGTAPNRVFTFEWNNFSHYLAIGYINIQCKLYETSNIIDFCYGTSGIPATATIGIANSTTDWQTLPNASTAPVPSATVFTTSIPAGPANGQVYRWSPNCVGLPAAITGGTSAFCSGSSITLADVTPGGTWSSSATGVATVGATTGIVTGVGAGGTATISYTITSSGCTGTTIVTVNPLPVAISGPTAVCAGNTITLTDLSGAGTWTSSNTGVATIGAASGVVTGVSSGTTTIVFTQTSTGCTTSMVLTVNPAASPITGTLALCQGNTVTLADASAGGTWTSSASGIASVGASTGIVSGVGVLGGTATITYTMTTGGCYATALVTVNPLPATITGSSTVCLGNTTTLTETTGGGTWSSSNSGVAPVGATTGVVTGSAVGSATISYSITATGCYTTFNETVNPLPSAITGPSVVCVNATISLSDATGGGTWSSSTPGIATINTSGVLTGVASGTDTVTYSLPTGCIATKIITILPIPAPITGDSAVCVASSITLGDITGGSTWSISGAGATIGTTTGIVTGVSASTQTVTYTITSTGCHVIKQITINPLPSLIAGVTTLCDSSTSYLLNTLPGGVWTSSNTSVVTIGYSTGVAYAVGVGIDTVTYTIVGTGCKMSTQLIVQPPPAPISGPMTVCPGFSITLSDLITGGTWHSGTPTVATIDSVTGIISGIASGSTLITYELGVCSTTEMITVNPLPPSITGVSSVCESGATTTLSNSTAGGSWTSASTATATIGSSTGIVTGGVAGLVTVTYTLPTGCYITDLVTVNPLPSPILGSDSVCLGYSTTLSDGFGAGTFSSALPAVASVNASTGVVIGNSVGSTTITFTLSTTGCQITTPYVVSAIVSIGIGITAMNGDTICAGNSDTYIASAVNPGPYPIYHWTVNSSPIGGTGSSMTYIPNNGDVVKCVLVSDAACAVPNTMTSNTITMLVNPVTYPTVTMTSTKGDTLCTGTANTYNVTSTSGGSSPTYIWTVNWVPVASGVTTYSYTPNNGDIIRCGMASSSPCPIPDTAFALDTVVVKQYDTPKVSIINLSGGSVCKGNMITLNANSVYSGWGPTYFWTINGVGVSGTTSITYTPSDSDVVNCTMISNYRCPVPNDTATATIRLTVDPVIQVTITGSPGSLVQAGYWDTLTAHVVNGGMTPTYQWYVNGVPISGAIYPTFIRNDLSNQDSVTCIVTTGSGSACEGVKGFAWMIMEVAKVGVNNVQVTIGDINLLPNPNNGTFRLAGTIDGNPNEAGIIITDVVGREVYKSTIELKGGTLDHVVNMGRQLPDVVYLLQLVAGNDKKVIRFAVKSSN